MPTRPPNPWNQYWESLPKGHFLFPAEGEEAARRLVEAIRLAPDATALDYGCGYGQAAAYLAPHVGRLFVWDYDEHMRWFAANYLKSIPNVFVWDPGNNEVVFDLIWINSVVQYMTPEQFGAVLTRCAAVLTPTGRVVVSDLIPPHLPFYSDVLSLVGFSLRKRYFWRAMRKTWAMRQRYSKLSKHVPLYHPTHQEVVATAAAAKLHAEYLPRNLTHFRGRETVVLTRAAA
jgi:SAM-dependent methyltransferase